MAKQLNVSLAFTADTSQAKAQIQDLQNSLSKLITSSGKGDKLGLTKELIQAKSAAADLQVALKNATTSTGSIDLSKFSSSIARSGKDLEQYRIQLQKLGPDGDAAFLKLAQSVVSAEAPLKRTNKLLDEFKTSLANTARWQISSSILHGFMGALQSAYGYAQDLNESLTNIRIVTGQTSEQMARFAENANKSAQALSTTTTKYTDAALIFYQQGLDDKAVKERTDATIKMSQATGDAVKDVSSYMTAIWNNFDNGSQSLEHYADVITALGASTASSSSEIASGLQQFAAIAETTGLSYEYATSALATLVSNTRQSADTIGNSLKTIFSRLQGLKLGETLEDGVDLNKYSKALQAIGIDLLDVNGNMMQMDDILDATAEKWDTMSQAQKMAFAQTVAGTRQYTQLMSLMDNWDDMQTNLNTARNADGTLQEQADIYAESWEAVQQRVKAAAQGIYQDLLNDKFFINLNNLFANVLQGIDSVINSIGGLKTILPMVGTLLFSVFGDSLSKSFDNMFFNIQRNTQAFKEQQEQLRQQAYEEAMKVNADSGTNLGDQKTNSLKIQLELQRQLQQEAENLDAQTVQELQSRLDIVKAYRAQVEEMAKIKDATVDNLQDVRQGLVNKTQRNGNNASDARQGLAELQQMQTAATVAEQKIKQLSKSFSETGDLNKYKSELKSIQRELLNNGFDSSSNTIKALSAVFNAAGQDINSFKQALENLVNNGKLADGAFKDIDAVAIQLRDDFGWTADETDRFCESVKKMTQAGMNQDEAVKAAAAAIEQYKQKIEEAKNAINQLSTTGQTLVSIFTGISQVMTGLSSLSNIWDAITNPDLSGIERFRAIALSLPMAITSLKSGIDTLRGTYQNLAGAMNAIETARAAGVAVQETENAAMSKNLIINGLLVSQKYALAAANHLAADSFLAEALAAYAALTPIALLQAAIVALIAVIGGIAALVFIFKEIKANSPEAKLKASKEEAKGLAEAANDAKDKVNELKSAFDSYDSVVDKLENCTKGTQEWRDAMEEVNNQVIDMLQKYPELASYLDSSDPSGLLKFKDGYEEVLANAQNAANSASLASIRKNADIQQQQVDLDKRNFYKDNNINSSQQKIIDENLDKFASIPFELLDSKIEGLSGISAEAYGELQKLSAASAAATAGLENVGAIAANSLDPDKYSQEARNMVANGYNDLVDKNKSDVLNEIGQFGRVGDNVGNNSDLKNLWDEYQKYGGQSGSLDKNSLRGWDGNKGRVKEFAYNDDNGDLKTVTAEQVAETIAAGRAMAELGASAEQASSALNNLDKKATEGVSEGIKGFINNGNLENLTQGDMKAIRDRVGEDGSGTEKYLQELFGTDDLKSLGIDPDAFNEALENAETAFDNFKDGFSKYVTNAFDGLDLSGLTLSAQKAVLEALNDAFAIGGVDGLNAMQDIFKNLAPEEAELFANTINNIDWNSNSVDSLRSTLQDLGIDTTNLSDGALQNLISAMREASATADDLASAFKSQKDVLGKLKDGDMISEEDYGKLDAAYQEYFAKQMDGSYKLIGSAEKLQETLQKDYEQKFLNRASDLKQQSNNLDHTNLEAVQGTSEGRDHNGQQTFDTDKAQLQLTLLNAIGEQYGVNKEKLSEWNAQMADGSANAQTYKEIAQAISEISVNEDMLTEASARCKEEIAQIAEQLLTSQTSYEGFQSALNNLFGEGIEVPLETLVMGLESLASQYPSCAEAAETYANSSREVEEAVKAEAEARDYLNKLEDNASGSAIARATEKLEEAQAYREATQEKMVAAQWDLELGILSEEASSAYGIEADRIKDLAEAFAEENDLAAENAEIARDLAVRNLRLNDAAADLTKNWKNYSDIMDLVADGTEDQIKAAKKEIAQTESLSKSFDSLKKSTAGLLNTSEKMFGDDFVLKNMKDIKKAAEGDEEALKRLQKAAAKEIAIQLDNKGVFDKLGDSADAVADWASNLPEGELGIDDTIYLQKLVNAMQRAGMTQAEIEDALGGLGIDVDLAPYEEGLNTVIDDAMEAGKLASDAFASNAGVNTEVKQETSTATDNKELLGYDVTEQPIPLSGSITTSGSFGGNLAAVVPGNATFSGTYPGVNVTPVTETATESKDTTATALEVVGANKSSGGNISRSNSGGGGGGRGGRGGRRGGRRGGGRAERKEYAASQHTDRSHVKYDSLNKSLDLMQKKYEKIGIAADHAFGTQRLKLIDKQIKKQKELRDQLQKVADESARLAKNEKALLTKKDSGKKAYYQDKDGKEHSSTVDFKQYGVKFNEDGTIANYADVLKAVDARHNDAAKNVNGKTGDAAAAAKDVLAKIDAENAVFLEWLEKYESDLAQSLDDANAVLEAQYEIISLSVTKIQEAVDMKINVKQMGLDILEDMLGRIGDNAWRAAESIALLTKQVEKYKGSKVKNPDGSVTTTQGNMKIHENAIKNIIDKHNEDDKNKNLGFDGKEFLAYLNGDELDAEKRKAIEEAINNDGDKPGLTKDEIEAIQEQLDMMKEEAQALYEIREQMFETISDTFNKMSEEMDKFTNKIEHLQSMSDHYKNIVEIVGADTLGITKEMQKEMNQASVQMAQGLVTTTRNKVEAIQGEIAITEEALQDAIARGNEHDIEAFTKLLDEQNEALMDAEEEFMQAWEDALQAAKDAFLADIEIISKELSDKLAGEKSSMDALRDSFDMAKEIEDDYLRDYEKMYLLDKMRRDVAKDIDESDSLNTRKELLAVQEKITKAMENGEKMSQYEIDNLQREYELTKARLALEEASQTKTQVTLTRDSEGNYSYVYGVDMDEVAKAEDEYNKKLYEMQKANDDYIHELEEKIIDLQAEAVSKLQEAAEMYGTDSEEYAAAMAEIQEWYSTQLTFYSDQMNIALTNNQELVDYVSNSEIKAFGNVGYAYEDNVTQFNQLILSKQTGYETLEDMVADSTQAIQDSIQEMTEAEEQYQANNEVTMEKAGTTMEDFAGKYQENIDNSISKTKEFEKESGIMKDKVLENFQGVVDGVEAFLKQYSDWIDQYIAKTEEYIKSFEKLNEIWTGLTTTKEPEKPTKTDPPKEDPPKSDSGGRRDDGGRRNNNSGKAKKVAEAIWIWGGDKSGWGSGNSRKKKLKEKGVSNAQTIINKEVKEKGENKAFNYVKESEWKNLKNYFYGKFDTGGYTGNWSGDGRFALLHQKELVLNKDDTKNFLSGIEILRKISQMIDLNALVASSSSISGLKNVIASGNIAREALEQFVNVTAEFPNVNSKQEIIEAFDNIVNLASQYASRT